MTRTSVGTGRSIESSAKDAPERFKWSATMLGLYIFTFAVVTFRLPVAEIGIGLALAGLFFQEGRFRMPAPFLLYVLFVLWGFLSSFTSIFPEESYDQIVERLKQALILLVVLNALRTRAQIRAYLIFFVACFVLFPARGALINYAVGYKVFGRALWNFIYSNPNDLAVMALIALGPALLIASSSDIGRRLKIALGASAGILLVVILLTQSRGTFIGLALSMGLVASRSMLKRGKQVLYGLVVIAVAAYFMPASLWERLGGIGKLTSTETIAEADPEGSAAQRWEIQKTAWRIFVDHPVMGVGMGAYPYANATYSPQLGKRDTHDTYLNLAAEVGLPGFLLWVSFYFSILLGSRRARLRAGSSYVLPEQIWIERALTGFLVAGIFGTYSHLTIPGLILGTLWCCSHIEESTNDMRRWPRKQETA